MLIHGLESGSARTNRNDVASHVSNQIAGLCVICCGQHSATTAKAFRSVYFVDGDNARIEPRAQALYPAAQADAYATKLHVTQRGQRCQELHNSGRRRRFHVVHNIIILERKHFSIKRQVPLSVRRRQSRQSPNVRPAQSLQTRGTHSHTKHKRHSTYQRECCCTRALETNGQTTLRNGHNLYTITVNCCRSPMLLHVDGLARTKTGTSLPREQPSDTVCMHFVLV